MNEKEANSTLGKASKGLAVAMIEGLNERNWSGTNVNKLQEALYEYGMALKSTKTIEGS